MTKEIKTALVSLFYKEEAKEFLLTLGELGIKIITTGGTYDYIKSLGLDATKVEDLTSYPSILGGRVKTLHPTIFGGILGRRDLESDVVDMQKYNMPSIDLVAVDLYPFVETVEKGASREDIIEKIDIGGVSLIRAAAKNYTDVLVVSSSKHFSSATNLLKEKHGKVELKDRAEFAAKAMRDMASYDLSIANWISQEFSSSDISAETAIKTIDAADKLFNGEVKHLRYGENPHQKGMFVGNLEKCFQKLNGKEISYNNLLDINAAVSLISEFSFEKYKEDVSVAVIIKHGNPCGLALSKNSICQAYKDAFACDTVSAFGGIVAINKKLDLATAEAMNSLFMEVLIAPDYENEALELLKSKKNRIILKLKDFKQSDTLFRTCLNGYIAQDRNQETTSEELLENPCGIEVNEAQKRDLLLANICVKHCRSNALAIVKDQKLISTGLGQTSRVDALKQAIDKAKAFGFELKGSALASDAFFPFADCVEIAYQNQIGAIIQPGGSIRDQESIDFCKEKGIPMLFTKIRHFYH